MEKFLYENRPMIYGLIAFYAIFVSRNSFLMVASGLVLLYCSVRIYKMRHDYKKLAIIEDLRFKLRK